MNNPIRPDKDDHYDLERAGSPQASRSFHSSFLSKKKWIILLLVLLVIIISLIAIITNTLSGKNQEPSNNYVPEPSIETTQKETKLAYQTLKPPAISEDATHSQIETNKPNKQRLEISGEITDQLEDKILELNQKAQDDESMVLEAKREKANHINELPLTLTIDKQHYTIQISASSSLQNMMEFAKQHDLVNYQIYETKHGEKPWFVLIKGHYLSINDAKEAISMLPKSIQKGSPWVKTGLQVNQERSAK